MMKLLLLKGHSSIWRMALLFLLLVTPIADALEPTPSKDITLEQAIVQVLERSPQLGAAEYESRAAAARIRQARLTTPYKVNLEMENFAGSGPFEGFGGMETTLSIARVLELGKKTQLRGDLAQQEASLLNTQQDARRLDLLAETARRFVHVATDQERLKIAREAVVLAQRTQGAVGLRVQAGRSPVAERRRADIALARAKLGLEHAEHELETSRLKLSTMWSETVPTFAGVRADLLALNPVDDFDRLQSLLERNPDLVGFATKQRVAEAQTLLARSRQRSDFQLAGGVRYLGVTDDFALVASASIPLGSRKRAANLVEESMNLSQARPLEYEQRRLELFSTLFEIHQELQHAFTAVGIFSNQIIPDAELAMLEYEKGFSQGRYSLLELTDAQRVLLNARLESVMAATDYHRNQIEIERLTGAALNTGVSP